MKSLDTKIYNTIIKDKLIRREVVRDSFEFFFRLYFDHYIHYSIASFQKEIMQLVSNTNIKNICITAFRAAAKSTIVTTAFPIWAILGKHEHKFIVIVCQTKAQAKQHMTNLKRELETNDLLKKDLGPFKEVPDEWSIGSIVFSLYDARITVVSTEQSLRGIRHNQHRPSMIICDDLEDLSSVKTTENRDKLYDWFTGDLLPAGDLNTRLILIGNKLHDDSLLMKIRGKIMGNEMEGVYREYPLIDSNGNCLWPEKYPDEVSILIEKKKVANEIAWQREFLLKIISKEDQIIKREWIQYYDEQDIKSIRAKEFGIGLDLAISMSENADYTAIVTGYVGHRNGKAYIFIVPNIVNKRLTSLETIDKIIEIERKLKEESMYTSKLLFLESNGYQKSIAEHLDIETSLKIETSHSSNSKDERLGSVAFLIESGTVLFPKTGAEQLINQVLGFGSERHDDLVDAMTILLKGLNPKLKRYAQFARLEYEEENWNTFNSREKQMILDRRGAHRPRPDAM